MTAATLYVGSVMHRRLAARQHRFRYRAFWLLVDVDQIDTACAPCWMLSRNRFNLFSLNDQDHGDGSGRSLRSLTEDDLAKAGIDLPGGKIQLLCMPRTLGYSFNPLSVFFCTDAKGAHAATIYEVHNTFGERHRYVIASGDRHHARQKTFYVSPFLQCELQYRFSVALRDSRLALAIRAEREGETVFIASMRAHREDVSDLNLLRCFARMPFVTLKVTLAIHWEALRLWLKRVPLVKRPVFSTTMIGPGNV